MIPVSSHFSLQKKRIWPSKSQIITSPQFQFPNSSTTTITFFNQLATTLTITALTNPGHLFSYSTNMTTKQLDHFSITNSTYQCHKHKNIHKLLMKHVSYSLAFGCHLTMSSTKKQTKHIHHFIATRMEYHMTHILTNNKCLKPGISPTFDQL